MFIVLCLLFCILFHLNQISGHSKDCTDTDMHCYSWIAEDGSKCDLVNELPNIYCRKSCHLCDSTRVPAEYDLKKVPKSLKNLAFLIGKWHSEFGGKAFFPTIPKSTYGEEVDFKLLIRGDRALGVLNYTAVAWDNWSKTEIHREHGFLSVLNSNGSELISLNTVMSNGFITVEEGHERGLSIELQTQEIGRISFSHDLPVLKMLRSWTLLDPVHLEARLFLSTTTHRDLTEHTRIIYDKIYP